MVARTIGDKRCTIVHDFTKFGRARKSYALKIGIDKNAVLIVTVETCWLVISIFRKNFFAEFVETDFGDFCIFGSFDSGKDTITGCAFATFTIGVSDTECRSVKARRTTTVKV